jgi:peptidoglycan hydrolase CwlO-like protein
MLSAWKKVFHTLVLATLILCFIVTHQAVHAESLEEIEKQISDLTNQLQLSQAATTPLEAEVSKLQKQITSIQGQIKQYEGEIRELGEDILSREKKIKTQYIVLGAKVRDFYKKTRFYSPLLTLLSSQSAGELTRELTYKEATADEDKELIVSITREIIQLETDKKRLESDKVRLAGLQQKIDGQRLIITKSVYGLLQRKYTTTNWLQK